MAKLVLSSGGSIVYQCFLDQARVTIGSERHNQVVIDDPAAEAEHAVIIPVGNDHILEDLRSARGTFLNGMRVTKHILQHGDVVQFGAFHLRYLNPRVSVERDLERTMLITGLERFGAGKSGESGPPPEKTRISSARVQTSRLPKGRVRVIAGSRAGETIELDRVVATFGRAGDQLAVIARRPHGYFITHVEGRRSPRVNRRPVGKDARGLHNGDVIEVADLKLEFLLD